jgi:Ner family transcriptional regulator
MTKIDAATKKLFHDPAKRRAWVIYQLGLQGRSLASLARDLGLVRSSPQAALARPYPRMERLLAEAVGVPVHELFPDRYSPSGERLVRMGRPTGKKSVVKDTAKTRRRNVDGSTPDRQGEAA